jgi:hypothetical protein
MINTPLNSKSQLLLQKLHTLNCQKSSTETIKYLLVTSKKLTADQAKRIKWLKNVEVLAQIEGTLLQINRDLDA